MVTRAQLLLALVGLVACGDAKTVSTTKVEVEVPVERDAPTKSVDAKPEPIAKADAKAETPEDTPQPEAGANAKADAEAAAPAGGAIGVPECDAYITKYGKCIETGVPTDIRDLMREAVEHSREAWKKAAAGSEKGDLPSICKGALAAAKQATAKYGCVW